MLKIALFHVLLKNIPQEYMVYTKTLTPKHKVTFDTHPLAVSGQFLLMHFTVVLIFYRKRRRKRNLMMMT